MTGNGLCNHCWRTGRLYVIHNGWSDAYADILRPPDAPEQHNFLNGNPACTPYDEPYRRYFKTRAELASANDLDGSSRWVFFPENFNWAFYEQGMLDQMVRDSQVAAMRELATQSFEEAMRWCARLVQREDGELFVSPRPETLVNVSRKRVEEGLRKIPPRMSIRQDETVRDWLLASDAVVSSYSTSPIEASVAGQQACILGPVPWPESLRQQWHALAPRLTSNEQLDAVAAGKADAADGETLARWARSALMSRGDAMVRITDQLARIRRDEVPEPEPSQSITPPSGRRLLLRVMLALRRHVKLRLRISRGDIPAESREYMAAIREAAERVRRWDAILDDDRDRTQRVAR